MSKSSSHMDSELTIAMHKLSQHLSQAHNQLLAAQAEHVALLRRIHDLEAELACLKNSRVEGALRTTLAARVYAEYDGNNHAELATRYRLSLQAVYRIVRDEHVAARKLALLTALETAPEDISVIPASQSDFLPVLEAVLQAAETAKARGCLDRFVIVTGILPPAPATATPESIQAATPGNRAKNQSGTPGRPDI